MIRPFTFLCMLLAGGAGLYLYQVKHRTRMLEVDIDHLLQETRTVRDRTGILQAEWAFLNDPARLQGLADANLSLKTVLPAQFVQMSDLDRKLPAVIVPEAAPAGADDTTDMTADATPPAAAPPATPPAPAPRPPVMQAAVAPAAPRKPAPVTQASVVPPPRAAPAPDREAALAAPPVRRPPVAPTPLPVAATRFHYAAVAPANDGGAAAFAPHPVTISGSALGNYRAALPPPVPVHMDNGR